VRGDVTMEKKIVGGRIDEETVLMKLCVVGKEERLDRTDWRDVPYA